MTDHHEELLAHADFVRALARSLVFDENGASDITQQAFLASLKNPPPSESAAIPWLARITRNIAGRRSLSEKRRLARERSVARPNRVPSTEEIVAREEIRRRVVEAVLELDEPYRSAILLRFYEDLSHKAAADELGVPIETYRTRLKRGLEKLRIRLDRTVNGDRGQWCTALAPLIGARIEMTAGGIGFAAGAWKLGAVLILLVGLGLVVVLTSVSDPAVPPSVVGMESNAGPEPDPVSASLSGQAGLRLPLPPPASGVSYAVRGRVMDSAGRPVDAARVYILWGFSSEEGYTVPGMDRRFGSGRLVETDLDGRYEIELDSASNCYVCLYDAGDPNMEPCPLRTEPWIPWQGQWIEPPAKEVDFTARIVPFGNAVIRISDGAGDGVVDGAECRIRNKQTTGHWFARTDKYGTAVLTLPLEENEPTMFVATISHESLDEELLRSFTIHEPGEVKELDIRIGFERAVFRGRVVNTTGEPVTDALVFNGSQVRMRGDEPFKPFDAKRIKDGVLTDSGGSFELIGHGRKISVWHPAFSPVTVPPDQVSLIELPLRGTITGRLLDHRGAPVENEEIALDRKRKAMTDGEGRFRFDAVECGVRGITLPGKDRFATVIVSPGKTVEAELGGWLPAVEIELSVGGVPLSGTMESILVGLDTVASFKFTAGQASPLSLEEVLPGNYLMLSSTGLVSRLAIDGERIRVDCGDADLTVHAKPRTRIFIVPEGAHELVLLMGGRCCSRPVPSSGKIHFDPLPRGRYHLCVDGRGILATVAVTGRGMQKVLETER
jgi:RNA polymerase sigma-70 factor (ECF subfamily)